jgi:hypothetical protein
MTISSGILLPEHWRFYLQFPGPSPTAILLFFPQSAADPFALIRRWPVPTTAEDRCLFVSPRRPTIRTHTGQFLFPEGGMMYAEGGSGCSTRPGTPAGYLQRNCILIISRNIEPNLFR